LIRSKAVSDWFRIPNPNPEAKQQLFVFHHAGGSANAYFKFGSLLPKETELVLCELPGRGGRTREPLMSEFEKLIQALVGDLKTRLNKRSVFFGHSFGALTAFEAAKRLQSPHVVGLALSSFLPPTEQNVRAREVISHLDDATLLKKLERFAPIPDLIRNDPKVLAFFVPILRADVRLMESYNASNQSLDLPAIVYAGESDRATLPEHLAEWAKFVKMLGPVQTRSGEHFHVFINSEEIIRDIHEKLF
jgi:medium-chain acyl-[acyl-carrier-protein] hydrolase